MGNNEKSTDFVERELGWDSTSPCSFFRQLITRDKTWCILLSFSVTYRLPLGVEDRRIPDSALSSSSRWDCYHGPHRARLNSQRRGRYRGAWSSRANNRKQWLQIDIGTKALVYGIASQGRQDAGQWVKAYKVMYSKSGVRWRWYQVRRRTMVSRMWINVWFLLIVTLPNQT